MPINLDYNSHGIFMYSIKEFLQGIFECIALSNFSHIHLLRCAIPYEAIVANPKHEFLALIGIRALSQIGNQ